MNQSSDHAAVCEIELRNGRMCGVSAIGRCTTCEHAFCGSHQARTSTNVDALGRYMPFSVPVDLDMCQECFATSPMELSRIKAQEDAARDAARREQEWKEELQKRLAPFEQAQDYFLSGEARAALRKTPRVPVYKTETSQKKGFFGSRRIETIVSTRYGWCIGKLSWSYTTRMYGDEIPRTETVLTIMLDQVIPPEAKDRIKSLVLVTVQPYADGYKETPLATFGNVSLIDAEKAVKRLAGESN